MILNIQALEASSKHLECAALWTLITSWQVIKDIDNFNTGTVPKSEIQIMFLVTLVPTKTDTDYWVYDMSTCLGMALNTAELSLSQLTQDLVWLRSTPSFYSSHPDGCTQYIARPIKEDSPLFVTCISITRYPPSTSLAYLISTKIERERQTYHISLFWKVNFPSVGSLFSHCEKTQDYWNYPEDTGAMVPFSVIIT